LLRFPSMANVQPDACQQAADWIAARLAGLGFRASVMEAAGRPNVALSSSRGNRSSAQAAL